MVGTKAFIKGSDFGFLLDCGRKFINFRGIIGLATLIIDKIDVDDEVCIRLRAMISDFRYENSWCLPILKEKYPIICRDIQNYILLENNSDKLVWNKSLDGYVICQ